MNTYVPCTECGAEILPSTAEATGGICMACKQGIRQSIEDSKIYYQEQKKYDPVRELWSSLVDRVYKTDLGYAGLTPDERIYYSVCCLEGEVFNGGMEQFFSNSSGELYDDVVNGLLELKAFRSLALLTQAKDALFGDVDLPRDQQARNELMPEYPDDDSLDRPAWIETLDKITTSFYEDLDGLGDRLDGFIRDRGLLEPFEKKVEQGGADDR